MLVCRRPLPDLSGPCGQPGPKDESRHEPGLHHCPQHYHHHYHYYDQAELVACPGSRNISRPMPDYPLGQLLRLNSNTELLT